MTAYLAFPKGKNVPAVWREEREDDFQALLREAHTLEEPIYCLCRPREAEKRRLAVRRYGPVDKRWYTLARYPRTGLEHAPTCDWYEAPDEASGRASYDTGVITELEDGSLAIRLYDSLEATRQRINAHDERRAGGSGVHRPSMTLRGLLDLSWERAGFDTWRPQFAGKRSWFTVNKFILQAAASIMVAGVPLAERFIAIVPGALEAMVLAVQQAWDNALQQRRGLLVLGQLKTLNEPELGRNYEAVLLQAAQGAYGIRLRAERALIEHLRNQFARELAAFAPESSDRVVALLHVRPREDDRGGRFGFVVDGAIARMTEVFIPVASSFESRVAHLLVEQGRYFRKPLRYDGEAMFPDFELLDTPRVTPMEVFGRSDAAYLQRRDEKIRKYRDLYDNDWWSWDATRLLTPPPFPPIYRAPRTHFSAASR